MAAKTFAEVMKSSPPTEETTTQNQSGGDSFSIFKTDDDKRLVFGWASISITVDGEQLEDRQKDMIDPEDLEEAAYEYVLNFRDTGEEHISTMRKKGKLVESCVFTAEKQKAIGIPEGTLPIGWWIGFKIEDDAAWERVKNGTYRMFSIEGKANREPVEKSRRDYDEYPEYGMWLEENLDATVEEQKAAKEYYAANKEEARRKWKHAPPSVAKTFSEILKFNPYHDAKGRFASENGYASFTIQTKDPKKQHWADKAVARMKEKEAAKKPEKHYDAKGFADYDEADFHQFHSGAKYYKQQQLTPEQKKAAANYLEAHPEPGTLYSHSQNMNYKMVTGQPLTGKYKETHDGIMASMHNLGYNVDLTRYDHPSMINGMLKALGVGTNYEHMSEGVIQKALIGQTVKENKFLSTSYNNFQNAANPTVFTSRAVRINYKAKASTQVMMPGNGPGGALGEFIVAPTNGKSNNGGKIVGVRFTGKMARRQGTQIFDVPQIEIDIEIG